jgi:hypothetical protein
VKKFAQGFPIPDRQPAPEDHVSSLGLEQLATETNVVVSESARAVVSVALPIGRFSCPPESRWFAEPRPRHGEFCSVWIADLCEPRNQAQIVSLDARIWSDFVPGTPVDQDAVGGNLL